LTMGSYRNLQFQAQQIREARILCEQSDKMIIALQSDVMRATMIGRKLASGSSQDVAAAVQEHGKSLHFFMAEIEKLTTPVRVKNLVNTAKMPLDDFFKMTQTISGLAFSNPSAAALTMPAYFTAVNALQDANDKLNVELDHFAITISEAANTQ
ncbi:hypothetical protein, partial [Candidatus Phycosocius spiralis]|uniref:hypothetical protein n=1 Tax=Candidatus Phycosocius spiralis TaxID=2815099 RepID=UPI0024E146DC